ncbi:MAG: DUF2125 domain-containing protein [Maricaulis sp.]|nr:DUF2125 domain-containing protein [Maricaulis sp.]MDG2045494.1 DUF2125 domain-containing protein [Maricaulis sp.]
MTSRIRYMFIGGGLVLLFVIYTVIWMMAKERIKEEVTLWINQQAEIGYTIEPESIRVSGFPYRFRISAENIYIALPERDGGWNARIEHAMGDAIVWDRSHWIFQLGGTITYNSVGENAQSLQINADGIAFSQRRDPDGNTIRIGGELSNMAINSLSGPAPEISFVERALWSAEIMPDDSLLAQFDIAGLAPNALALEPQVAMAFGTSIQRVRLNASVQQWTALATQGDTREWALAGGLVDVTAAELEWGAANITGNGVFDLDDRSRLQGNLTVNVTDPDTLADTLVAADLASAESGQALRLAAMMAPRGPEGSSLSFRIQNEIVYLGPIPLGRLGGTPQD